MTIHRSIVGSLATLMMAATLIPAGMARAQEVKPIEYRFDDNWVLRFSGQINMGVLYYDDGEDGDAFFADNDNSSSRARLQLFNTLGDWKFEAALEAEYQPVASNTLSQLNTQPNWEFPDSNFRKIEISIGHEDYGKLWLGQGSMASDGSAEFDNSGTSVIAYSSIPDTTGGMFFRFEDDGLSGVTVGSAFSNLDGLGRKVRVRYDTPTFHGFGLRASYGQDLLNEIDASLYDIAAVYSHDDDVFVINGGIALARNEGTDTDIFSGSISGRHKPSGISLTVAAGHDDTPDVDGTYGYFKLGYQHDFFEMGTTAFSVDYYYGDSMAAAGSRSNSVGLAAVQNIDRLNMQLWLLWRNHHYNDDAGPYDDGQAVFGGAIVKF
jgi:hypothetical protein